MSDEWKSGCAGCVFCKTAKQSHVFAAHMRLQREEHLRKAVTRWNILLKHFTSDKLLLLFMMMTVMTVMMLMLFLFVCFSFLFLLPLLVLLLLLLLLILKFIVVTHTHTHTHTHTNRQSLHQARRCAFFSFLNAVEQSRFSRAIMYAMITLGLRDTPAWLG